MTDQTLWVHKAACRGYDPEMFFPDHRSSPASIRGAITVCLGCPVRRQCADLARSIGATHGIWSGVLLAVEKKKF